MLYDYADWDDFVTDRWAITDELRRQRVLRGHSCGCAEDIEFIVMELSRAAGQ